MENSTTPATPSSTPSASPTTPAPASAAKPPTPPSGGSKKGHLGTMVMFFVMLLLVIAAGAAAWNYKTADKKSKDEVAAIKSKLEDAEAKTHDLPEGAIKVSECIPNMGYHYVAKESDPVYGPFLLVNKAGRVIGVEYMFDNTMMTPIPNIVPSVAVQLKASPMYNWDFDHTEVSRAPEGHEGFLKDHNDVHNYTVTADVQKQACI